MKAAVTEVKGQDGVMRFHVTKNGRGVSHATAIAALKATYPNDTFEALLVRERSKHASIYVRQTPKAPT